MSNITQTLRFFWKYTKRYPEQLVISSLIFVQYGVNVVFVPLMIGFGIGKLSRPDSIGLSFGTILWLIAIAASLGILCNRISTRAIDTLEIAATKDIHHATANHIIHESYEFHSKSFSGALISQATRLAASYVTFIDSVFLDAFRTLTVVIASSLTLSFYDVRLAAIMATTSLAGIITTALMVRKRYPLQRDAIAKSSEHTAYLADMITNAVTIKTFAAEQYELQKYRRISAEAGEKVRLAWSKQINANNITLAMVSIMNLSIVSYGIYAVQNGFLLPGVFIAAQLYAIRLSGAFWDTSRTLRTLERVFADAHEMVGIMQDQPQVFDESNAKRLLVSKGALAFKNVSFHYGDNSSDNTVLQGFSLEIKPGEKVGLVGRSGGGKSTITKLALRFMDIPSGEITIDQQNIAGVTQRSLRAAIAYVPQEPLLFHRTIAENIGYGKQTVSTNEIIKAAKLAQAHDFIMSLPKQYQTEVGERGVKLSGGQRQRIAIARAILKDAPILLLDEATSALDSESEVHIQKALWKLMEKRTALVIAHRLSTVQKMDRIVVIDNGKILEEGTHKELLANKGVYADLWNHQSGGFIEE